METTLKIGDKNLHCSSRCSGVDYQAKGCPVLLTLLGQFLNNWKENPVQAICM